MLTILVVINTQYSLKHLLVRGIMVKSGPKIYIADTGVKFGKDVRFGMLIENTLATGGNSNPHASWGGGGGHLWIKLHKI